MAFERLSREPPVTILTPVYNGGKYLEECIRSVLSQNYHNWEYVIVNNCSTDNTLEISMAFCERDPRIKVFSNEKFVNCEENHNIAFQKVPPESKYCKVVSADDWVLPDCLHDMVSLAEFYPNIGIVGSYQLSNNKVKWNALPPDKDYFSGREICRMSLIEGLWILGNPTSVLYRSDIVRNNVPFFPHHFPNADTSACYKYLQISDFGFIHKVLSVERVHTESVSAKSDTLHMDQTGNLDDFLHYGPFYLDNDEFERGKKKRMASYYKWLGGCVLKMKGIEFWRFQSSRLKDLGLTLEWGKIAMWSIFEIVSELRDPRSALKKLINVLKSIF